MRRLRVFSGNVRWPRARNLSGFSLIELMVSLAIGLLISAAAFSAYLGAASANKMAEAQGRMNEDAQAALTILTQQLRMAGSNPDQANRADSSRIDPVYSPYGTTTFSTTPATFSLSAYSIRGCAGTFSNLATAARLDDLSCAAGAGSPPDSIAVSYEADAFNSVTTAAKVPTDCTGAALEQIAATFSGQTPSGPFAYYVADNRFYVGTAPGVASPSLYCKGNGVGGVAQALVENIEDLQLSLGMVSTSTPAAGVTNATVAGYLRAGEVINLAATPSTQNDADRWAKVITVRLCVLVRSEALVAPDLISARYLQCDGTLNVAPADRRLRRAYATTVVLRNRRM